jgi:hypothetical protein
MSKQFQVRCGTTNVNGLEPKSERLATSNDQKAPKVFR